MFGHLNKLKNKRVQVSANGIMYKGVLKEITEDSVTLRTETGWATIPIDSVRRLEEEGAKGKLDDSRSINRSFFRYS